MWQVPTLHIEKELKKKKKNLTSHFYFSLKLSHLILIFVFVYLQSTSFKVEQSFFFNCFPGMFFPWIFLALVTSSRVYHRGVILSFAQNSIEADELSVVLDIVYYFRLGLVLFLSHSWIFVFFWVNTIFYLLRGIGFFPFHLK